MSIDLYDLPLAELRAWLEQSPNPDANIANLPGSVGPNAMASIPAVALTAAGATVGAGYTAVAWDSTYFDYSNMWRVPPAGPPPSARDRIHIPIDGIYVATGFAYAVTGSDVAFIIRHQGVSIFAGQENDGDATANPNAAGIWLMKAGDYVEGMARVAGGGAVDAFMSVAYLGPYRADARPRD